MEVGSGFLSKAASTNMSDGQTNVEGEYIFVDSDTAGSSRGKLKKRRIVNRSVAKFFDPQESIQRPFPTNSKVKRNLFEVPTVGESCKISTDKGGKSNFVEDISAKTYIQSGSIQNLRGGSIAEDIQKCDTLSCQFKCVFCGSSKESEVLGAMVHYLLDGKPVVTADLDGVSNIIHTHRNCIDWTPNVYFENENAINLDTEIARSKKIKCSLCGIKGAALGCYEKNCQKSFHVSCARLISRCRWDVKNFVMLCPLHPYSELPKEKCGSQGGSSTRSTTKGLEAMETEVSTQQVVAANQQWKWSGSDKKWVLCCSMHTAEEKEIVSAFLKLAGVLVLKNYGPSATHVLVSTDENGACTRNLKFLMGILEGKWILSIDWVKGCMKAMEPVAEEKYEISVDIYGTSLRPRLERLQVGKKKRKLFDGYTFYFTADFLPWYKKFLQDLVATAGGFVLDKPLLNFSSPTKHILIYSLRCDSDDKFSCDSCCKSRNKAEALTSSRSQNKMASYTWILDSIVAGKLQAFIN